jgi:hypothetical protein
LKSTNKYKVGQFVRWYEAYAEGMLGRDAGFGIITAVNVFDLGFKDGPYTNYKVLRNKHGDLMSFEEGHIESQEDFEDRTRESSAG